MTEIVNLRQVRKAKLRAEKDKIAQANRAEHGIAKSQRKLAQTLAEKAARAHGAHKLEPDK